MRDNYHFKVGSFECTVVPDGTFTYPHPGHVFFANAPQDRLEQVLGEHHLDLSRWEHYTSPYPTLVINTGRHRVLVDTGAGEMAPTTGKLIPNLRAEGLGPEDIDTVIITHAHPDHVGGSIDSEGKPAFPNARYVMQKQEWDFWTSEPDLARLPVAEYIKDLILTSARNCLPPIQGQIEFVDDGAEIVPGIYAVAAPGHTPGHMALSISVNGQELLYTSDAALHPIHLEQPKWYAAVDLAPEQALDSRRRLLEKAVAENALVLAFHFPAPGLGHVVQKGDAWKWQPIGAID